MNDRFPYLLVIANSARMLAQAARLAGFFPLVIDCYGDRDTLGYAQAWQQISSLELAELEDAAGKLAEQYPIHGVVYGSGFEDFPETLAQLETRFTVFGNKFEVFYQQHEKDGFFETLDELGIPYPEVSFVPPGDVEGWLVKPLKSQGGLGVARYKGNVQPQKPVYWQRFQRGTPCSVLFLADGKCGQIIGFNQQWVQTIDENNEFVFSGAMSHALLDENIKARIADWLTKLVPAFSLRGLNSLDFLQCREGCYALEINPRPPASMQLYDGDLFTRHVKACLGELSEYQCNVPVITGIQIVYAIGNRYYIPPGFEWPVEAQDLPHENTWIGAGQPICSIITHGKTQQTVLAHLQQQQQLIIYSLERFQTHGI